MKENGKGRGKEEWTGEKGMGGHVYVVINCI